MPNHVHVVCQVPPSNPREETTSLQNVEHEHVTLTEILQSVKKYTALKSNRLLARSGQFWHRESYDHVIRDSDELERTIWYIVNNPVKAGLVEDWHDWQWTYVKAGLVSIP
jgi:REP element-mobilizing transposase RayT